MTESTEQSSATATEKSETESTTQDIISDTTPGSGRNVRLSCDFNSDCKPASGSDGSCIFYGTDNEVICFCDSETCFHPVFVDVNDRLDEMDNRGLWPFVRICIDDCYMDGAWLLTAMGFVMGWVIITGSISACCADKCAYYYNLTFNIILCLAFVAVDLYFGIMEDVTWDIAGGALGGVLFVMVMMIGLVCAMCTDSDDDDYEEYYDEVAKTKYGANEMKNSSSRRSSSTSESYSIGDSAL